MGKGREEKTAGEGRGGGWEVGRGGEDEGIGEGGKVEEKVRGRGNGERRVCRVDVREMERQRRGSAKVRRKRRVG